jgi:hypothetical protein
VIKESDGSVAGCHSSRADAIKQQRALYANESRMASMYDELDAQPVEVPQLIVPEPAVASALSPFAAELVGMLLKDDREKSLVASMVDSQAQARLEAAEDRRALVAALQTLGSPVVNVPAPEVSVHVPPAEISVNVPPAEVNFTVPPAEVNVHVPPAAVNVTVEAPAPVQKTVTFERDPLTHEVVKAEVTET